MKKCVTRCWKTFNIADNVDDESSLYLKVLNNLLFINIKYDLLPGKAHFPLKGCLSSQTLLEQFSLVAMSYLLSNKA